MCMFQRFLLELWTQCVLVSEVPVRAVDAVCACFRVPVRAVDTVCACFRGSYLAEEFAVTQVCVTVPTTNV